MQTGKLNIVFLSGALAFFFITMVQPLCAQTATEIRIVKMAPADGAAVVKLPGRQLKLVRPGDYLDGWGTVRGIAADRLVIEHAGATGAELIVIRVSNGEQTIDRIGRTVHPDEKQLRPRSPGPSYSQPQDD